MDNEITDSEATGSDASKAEKWARCGYPSQFYPDARDLAGAAKLQLQGGGETDANLVLTLEPFHSVSATAYPPGDGGLGGDRPGGLSAVVTDGQGHQLPYAAA